MWDRDELYSAYLESNYVLKLYEVYDQPKVHIYEEFRGGSLSDLIFKTFKAVNLKHLLKFIKKRVGTMITFNQLKYNTVWYTMGQVPWIRLILLLLFLTLSTLVYYFSIQMHEATIFKISGRVDFLNMPILDKIENKTKEWWNKDIESVEGSSFTLFYIMQNWFLQEKPLKIEKIRRHFRNSSWLQ